MSGASFDVLVNATPLGMHGSAPGDSGPSAAPLPARLIFDMVYRPRETPLIQRARAQGLPVITGVEMFLHQGARQFELWTGQPAPEAEMLRVLLEALDQP
jgi:3-dehydroquinate dehydratase/shikimate dehydrogenase